MNWNLARGLVYLACLAASGLALAGLADFDLVTGSFDLRPFNLYALTGTAGGVISSALASVALWRGWGRKLSLSRPRCRPISTKARRHWLGAGGSCRLMG